MFSWLDAGRRNSHNMWAPQIAGIFLVICTSSHSVPTTHLPEAAGGYRFGWKVQDDATGDYKTHHEEGTGEGAERGVRGEYTVGEPNGDLRVVSYSVAPGTGFRATVKVLPGGSPVGASPIGGSPVQATPADKPEGTVAPAGAGLEVELKGNRPPGGVAHVEPQQVRPERDDADHQNVGQDNIDKKPPQDRLEQQQLERSKHDHPDHRNVDHEDEINKNPPQLFHIEQPQSKISDEKHTNHQNISNQTEMLNNKPSELFHIEQTQLETTKQNHHDRQSTSQQILDKNKSQAADQSEEGPKPEQGNAEIKSPQNIATEDLNGNKTQLDKESGQGKKQERPNKTGNASKTDLTTDSSLTEKPVDLLKDLPYIDKHIHNIEYIIEEEREEELQAKQNDFVAGDFSQGNKMIVKVHENEANKNHDLLELASDPGEIHVSQGSSGRLQINVGKLDMAVDSGATTVDKKRLQPPVNIVTDSSIKSTPDTRMGSFAAGTSQPHAESTAQSNADKTTDDSDHTREGGNGLKEIIDDSKNAVNNFQETSAHRPIDSVILATLMMPTSPVVKFTCLRDEAVKNGLRTEPAVSIVPTTNTHNTTHSHPEPSKAYVTTTFPILPFTMMNLSPTSFQPARPLLPFLPQGSKSPQAGHVMNNYVMISTTIPQPQPQPTNTAHIDKHMSFKARSNLQSGFSPVYSNGALYPSYLLPPPWVRAQQHHGPRHMPIFVLPMSHNVNFAPTFNPDMYGKHNQK